MTTIQTVGPEIESQELNDNFAALNAGKVEKTGDTMTGPLTLSGDPTSNLHAATKQYIDSKFALKTQPGWASPTLLNSWANHTDTSRPTAAYFKDEFGIVRIEGVIQGGTIGSTAFILPAGYRPGKLISRYGVTVSQANVGVDINAAGSVSILSGNNTFISFSGISFRAEL